MYLFGSGALFGIPTADINGNAIANPTPIQFGGLQDVSLDISFDIKELYGQQQYAMDMARGKAKISGKAKKAIMNGALLNNLFFGGPVTTGILNDYDDLVGTAIPATPFTITPTYPNTGVWATDLGVNDINGRPYTRVAAAPATGQYSVTAGAYLFAAADTGKVVFIAAQYTATSTTAPKIVVPNAIMGSTPTFRAEIYIPYEGKSMIVSLAACVSQKFSFATKLDDYVIPEFDFIAYGPNGTSPMTIAMSE
jgi:hypothetical protein